MILYHCIVLSIIIHYYITWYDIIYSYVSHSMVDRHVATLVLVMQHSKVRFFSFCLCITCWWTDKMKPPGVHVLPATLACFYKLVATKTGAAQKRAFEIGVLERSVIDHIVFCVLGCETHNITYHFC